MTLSELIDRIIDEGIEAARRDYDKPYQTAHLAGAVSGFESCRGKKPSELLVALTLAKRQTQEMQLEYVTGKRDMDGYWFTRCYELEIEWVLNCVSAVLHNEGFQPLIPFTARAVINVAKIVGVKEG